MTLDPDAVRRANRLRRGQSLSAFVNDAVIAYTVELERAVYEQLPATAEETDWAQASAARFVGDDDEDWEQLFPEPQA